MAIGTTGSVQTDENGNPIEDTRQTSSFNYTPVDPQEDMMRQAFEQSQRAFNPPPPQPQGPTPYWENPETYYPRQQQIDPIAQAKAATMAAQKFIAFRGYQSDLKEGMAAADAFAKWGPMLVQDTSFGPSMKAMIQPKPYTYNEATRAYESPGQRPVFNPHASPAESPQFVPANPQTGEPAHYLSGGKAQFLPNQTASKIDPLTVIDYKGAESEFLGAKKVLEDPAQPEAIKTEALTRMKSARNRMENIRKSSGPQQTPASTAAPKEIVRLTKDGKQAVFDADTKKFIRYAD